MSITEKKQSIQTASISQIEARVREANSLPCLYSNISTEIDSKQHRKAATALGWNVKYFAEKHGLENLGFLTLTFRDHIVCPKAAQKRLNSLISHVIKPRYGDYVGVMERQKSGRIHYHMLVNVRSDIRTGVDFKALARKDYSSANQCLRGEWAFWRKSAPKYRFGRTELLPVMSSSEAIGRYVGKYIGKHIEQRQERDKNARLVRYSTGARVVSTRYQFLTDGSEQWRKKVKQFAHMVAERHDTEPSMAMLSAILGPRWAHNHREYILSMPG